MSNEAQISPVQKIASPSFGTRLKAAREELMLTRSEVAKQLRLNENIIILMEKDKYSPTLPTTFVRGYLRAYGKFLQIPEYEINKALEHIVFKQILPPQIKPLETVSSDSYFMRSFTTLIFFGVIGLTGAWWYNQNHAAQMASVVAEVQQTLAQPQQLLADISSINSNSSANTTTQSVPATAEPTNRTSTTTTTTKPATDITPTTENSTPSAKPLNTTQTNDDNNDEDETD
jgi:cytoskeleton protein RodZ